MLTLTIVAGLSIVIAASITARQRLRATLLAANTELRARLRLLEGRCSEAILILDADGLVQGVNGAAEELTGYQAGELLGLSFLRLTDAGTSPGVEAEIRRKDGSRVRGCFRVAEFTTGSRTNRYLFFERFSRTDPRAKSFEAPLALAGLERVVGKIAAQFENLLTAINGYGELAMQGVAPGTPVRNDLEEIVSASERASQLTRELLAFSANQIIPTEPVSLNAIIEHWIRDAGLRAQFEIELDSREPVVLGNYECLMRIVTVLCDAARVRVAPGQRLRLATSRIMISERCAAYTGVLRRGSYGVLSIRDTGPALTPEESEHLFDPFYFDATARGMDLPSIYGMVKTLGGGIHLRSDHRGTTFDILIPLEVRTAEQEFDGLDRLPVEAVRNG